MWFSFDVFFSTASILHLLCISCDRFLSITNCLTYYYKKENPKKSWRIRIIIGSVWVTSALLSFMPIFTDLFLTEERAEEIKQLDIENTFCIIHFNLRYRIVTCIISFWLPGTGMIVFYCLLMRKAQYFLRQSMRLSRRSALPDLESLKTDSDYERYLKQTKRKSSVGNALRRERWNKEYRVIKTLGSKILIFCLCWFFFFLNHTICTDEIISCEDYFGKRNYIIISDVLSWIGYLNSMVNPFLYHFTNTDFHRAFLTLLGFNANDNTNMCAKIFCCKKKTVVVRRKKNLNFTPYRYSVDYGSYDDT